MAAARATADPRDRLVVEILARTGMRASELCDLAADAVIQIGDGHWLRVPVGKLRNDRYIPLHPDLVDLLADWTATNVEHIRATGGSSPTSTRRSTGAPFTASSPRIARAAPASATCTPTNCATPSPPRPSTAACASKPSPRCSATDPWR